MKDAISPINEVVTEDLFCGTGSLCYVLTTIKKLRGRVMNDIMTIILTISGVGFGLGLCGVGVLAIINWLDRRDDNGPSFRT